MNMKKITGLLIILLLLGGIFKIYAQVSYSQDWSATGLNSWTTSGSVFSRTTSAICQTTGSIRGERYYEIADNLHLLYLELLMEVW